MDAKFSLAATAALIADPGRAAMLTCLLGGQARTAGELARAASVSPQSASMHLSQLLAGGLIQVAQDGRYRYFRISSPEVAHAVEALGVISSPRKQKPVGESPAIAYARTCYDHLAGIMAVSLADSFERKQYLTANDRDDRRFEVTPAGEQFLKHWKIDVNTLRAGKRGFAGRCLDWTERRDHIAGALGAAICEHFLRCRWIRRDPQSRIVHLTSGGRRELEGWITPPLTA
jgi:DNA-binding transcriptional ArsR family regulator